MFETFIISPIFNLLLMLYAWIGDFGLAIMIFTILIRMAMWPLLRKQLHQSKKMRELQPEIKKIRARNKGNRQAESAEMMELYKKHEVSPVGSFGILLIQLPVFIGLFAALRSFINSTERMIRLPYDFIRSHERIQEILTTITDKTNEAVVVAKEAGADSELFEKIGDPATNESLELLSKEELIELYENVLVVDVEGVQTTLVQGPYFMQELFGVIDLSTRAISDSGIYWPLMIISILAGVFQYMQTKQLTPSDDESDKKSKSFSELMKNSAKGGDQPDQSEISAAMTKRMGLFFAPLITFISATSPGGLALYFMTSGLVGMIQQRIILRGDVKEMEEIADETETKDKKNKNKNKSKKKKNKGTSSKKKKR